MKLVNDKTTTEQPIATNQGAVAGGGAVDVRKAELVAAGFLALIAVIAVVESVGIGAGWGASGPQPGFLPFLMGTAIAVGAIAVAVRAILAGDQGTVFEQKEEIWEVLRVGVPILLAVVSIYVLGFYLMVALYSAAFIVWYGHYRWYVVVPAAVALTAVLYWALEFMFRAFLPKSIFYGDMFWV